MSYITNGEYNAARRKIFLILELLFIFSINANNHNYIIAIQIT